MEFLRQWSGVSKYMVSDPGTFFEHYDETHGVGYPLAFLLVTWLVVTAPLFLLAGGYTAVTDPTNVGFVALAMLFLVVFLWLGVALEAIVVHGILFLFGARGVSKTLEAYAFPSAVRHCLWYVPLIGAVPGLYGWYLQIKALSRFHDVSVWKAALAAIFATFLPFVIVVLLAVVGAFVLGIGAESTTRPPAAAVLAF